MAAENQSGADHAMDAIRFRIWNANGPVKSAVDAYGAALRRASNAQDLDAILPAAARLHLAAEALEEAAKLAKEAAKDAIVQAFEETGCPGFYTATHHITAAEKPRTAIVTDPSAIPAHLMTTPAPQPDKRAIAKALTAGPVPGAQLSNGGALTIRFTAIKSRTAA